MSFYSFSFQNLFMGFYNFSIRKKISFDRCATNCFRHSRIGFVLFLQRIFIYKSPPIAPITVIVLRQQNEKIPPPRVGRLVLQARRSAKG